MTTHTTGPSQFLMWLAGISVIVFSAVSVAAIMGWIPTSMGRGGEITDVGDTAKHAPATAKSVMPKASVNLPASAPARVAADSRGGAATCGECGVIESEREVSSKGEGSGIGAVGGAVLGGLIGTQVGEGRGNTAATAIGAVGGAVAGNEVEKRVKTTKTSQITVRMNDGSSRVINTSGIPAWRIGDRVKIVGGAIQANP